MRFQYLPKSGEMRSMKQNGHNILRETRYWDYRSKTGWNMETKFHTENDGLKYCPIFPFTEIEKAPFKHIVFLTKEEQEPKESVHKPWLWVGEIEQRFGVKVRQISEAVYQYNFDNTQRSRGVGKHQPKSLTEMRNSLKVVSMPRQSTLNTGGMPKH